VEAPPEITQQRPPLLGERRRESRRGVEGLGNLEEVLRVQAPAAHRAADPRIDVVRRADADAGALLEQRTGLVGLVEAATDDDRVVGRLEGLREAPRRVERGLLREARADRRELQQRDGAGVHQPAARGGRPLSDGLPGTRNRHGTVAHGSPA
jgi:hypothetical protein